VIGGIDMDKRSKHVMDFCVAGFTYWDGPEVVQQMKVGDKVELKLEDDNPYDPEAVALYYDGRKIGFIPQEKNSEVHQLLYFGHDIFEASICQLDFEAHPERQVRAAIRLKDARKA